MPLSSVGLDDFSKGVLDNCGMCLRGTCAAVLLIWSCAFAQSPEPDRTKGALIEAKARAIAEYRLPLPGAVKVKNIEDGIWFNALSDSKKVEMFARDRCAVGNHGMKCSALRKRLTELYSDKSNLRIPYLEAVYIISLRENGAPEPQIMLETGMARETMNEYYSLLDKPSLYLTYGSLAALRNDISDNALKRDRIVKQVITPDTPVITIESASVRSVAKSAKWPGVIVMTYEKRGKNIIFGAVYVSATDLKNTKTHDFIENLRQDDLVQIIGSVYSFESWNEAMVPSEAIRFVGDVYPVAKSD